MSKPKTNHFLPGYYDPTDYVMVHKDYYARLIQERDDALSDYRRWHQAFLDAKYPDMLPTRVDLEARLASARALLQRCADDPGVAFNKIEQEAMRQLWADVESWLADVKDGPHNVASPSTSKGGET